MVDAPATPAVHAPDLLEVADIGIAQKPPSAQHLLGEYLGPVREPGAFVLDGGLDFTAPQSARPVFGRQAGSDSGVPS
jgi:hypothetical protein